jgi:hypothetical protein
VGKVGSGLGLSPTVLLRFPLYALAAAVEVNITKLALAVAWVIKII